MERSEQIRFDKLYQKHLTTVKLLPVEYFMVTFTLPAQLRALAWQHQRQMYDLLLRTAADTLKQFGTNSKKLDADPGMTGVLQCRLVADGWITIPSYTLSCPVVASTPDEPDEKSGANSQVTIFSMAEIWQRKKTIITGITGITGATGFKRHGQSSRTHHSPEIHMQALR